MSDEVMTMEEMERATLDLREEHKKVLDWFKRHSNSWLILGASVYAHQPQRDEKGYPMALFGDYVAQGLPRQERLCLQSDGFTYLELEIVAAWHPDDNAIYKVLSNRCFDRNYTECQAFAHPQFVVGQEVTFDQIKKYYIAYSQLSNLRAN